MPCRQVASPIAACSSPLTLFDESEVDLNRQLDQFVLHLALRLIGGIRQRYLLKVRAVLVPVNLRMQGYR